jgi:ArsR family transcriptional regulator
MGNPDLKLQETSPERAKRLRGNLLDFMEATRLSRQAQALSDPTRLTLLKLLADAGELCVSDLCVISQREQSGVSRHLRILWDTALVEKRRFDLWVYYKPSATGQRLLAALLDE